MATYYLTKFSSKAEEIGDYPQCMDFEKGLAKKDEDVFYEIDYSYERDTDFFRPKLSSLNGLKLYGRAKKTNILSQTVGYMPLLDEKALEVILKYNIGEYEVIPATVIRRKIPLQYYFLYYLSKLQQYIDLPECEFQKEDSMTKWEIIDMQEPRFEKHRVDKRFYSFKEYMHWIATGDNLFANINPTKVVFKKGCPTDRDLFRIPGLASYYWFSSEKLKEGIEENKITGLDFYQPVDVIFE